MSNAISRNRTIGIAKETTFGTAPASATYVLPVISWKGGEKVNLMPVEAMSGGIYKELDVVKTTEYAEPSFEMYVDESSLPLLLLSFGTVSSALVASETTVYNHTFTFTTSNQKVSYTLFVKDANRTDLTYTGFRINTLDLSFEKNGLIKCSISGTSMYPTTGTFTNTLTAWKLFSAVNCDFKIADEGGSLASVNLLGANLKHNHGVSGEDDNLYLGNKALAQSFNKEAQFNHEVTLHFSDTTYKNKWNALTKQKFTANITDTTRVVTGSTASTNPKIQFTYPSAYFGNWSEEGNLNDILKQKLPINIINETGTSNAPVQIIATNAVTSY